MGYYLKTHLAVQWCHNGRDVASNHQPHHCILNRLFRRGSKKTSKLRVTGLCARNSPVIGEFPAQRASNAEMFSFDDVIMELKSHTIAFLTNLVLWEATELLRFHVSLIVSMCHTFHHSLISCFLNECHHWRLQDYGVNETVILSRFQFKQWHILIIEINRDLCIHE